MTLDSIKPGKQWRRLRMAILSASAVINSEPKYLGSLKPIAEEAILILNSEPSLEALEEVEYFLRKIESFVEKWRPDPTPTQGDFYIQPEWASSIDNEAQEALRLIEEMQASGLISLININMPAVIEESMKVFISHSSIDKDIAESFVSLLRLALPLSAKDIRCTSVDGYKLDAGTNSDEQLRREVFESEAFLALLSPKSIQSIYVMFEMGARWGAKRYLAPVMIAGLMPNMLKAPLSAIHAISASSERDIYQLIDTLSKKLGLEAEKPALYAKALKEFINASSIS